MSQTPRLVLEAGVRLGESPVWLADAGQLAFVDIIGRRLHRFDPAAGGAGAVDVDEDIGCLAPCVQGGFVAALRSGVWRLNDRGGKIEALAENPQLQATHRFNDGKVDPRGRLWVGTIDEGKTAGDASLYRLDRRGLTRVSGDLMTSNGLAFAPDGRTLYHSDTPRFVVWRYDYDPATGEAEHRRGFLRFDAHAADRARPDGAAVDAEGCYWTALYDGGRLERYDPDGKLISRHDLPVRRPTMPAFGGADLRTLYVTTAKDDLGAGGGLYAFDPGVAGLPVPPFDLRA